MSLTACLLALALGATPDGEHSEESHAAAHRRLAPSLVTLEAVSDLGALIEQMQEELGPSVQLQRPPDGLRARASFATGIALDDHGTVATAATFITRGDLVRAVLADGRRVAADVIGLDWATDLGLVRLRHHPTVAAPLAAGDRDLNQGMPVCLVSAVPSARCPSAGGRLVEARLHPGAGRLHDFLLVDVGEGATAAGAAVLDARGQVIGMVTAQREGGGALAIPAATIRRDSQEMLAHGYVRRGWLGVSAVSGAGEQRRQGIRVAGVVPHSPAELAGVLPGDILLSWRGEPVGDMAELVGLVALGRPGEAVALRLNRAGVEREIELRLGERPRSDGDHEVVLQIDDDRAYLGLQAQELTAELRREFAVPAGPGLLVSSVHPRGPAAAAGLRPGDVLTSIAGERVSRTFELSQAVLRHAIGETVAVGLWRAGKAQNVPVTLTRRPSEIVLPESRRSHLAFDAEEWRALTDAVKSLPPDRDLRSVMAVRQYLERASPRAGEAFRRQIQRLLSEIDRRRPADGTGPGGSAPATPSPALGLR